MRRAASIGLPVVGWVLLGYVLLSTAPIELLFPAALLIGSPVVGAHQAVLQDGSRVVSELEAGGAATSTDCDCGCAEVTCSSPWRGDEHLEKPPVEPASRRRGPRRITQGEALADLPDLRARPRLADQPYRWRLRPRR